MPSTTKKIVDALIAAERAKMEAEAKAKEDADIAAIKAQHEASEAREKARYETQRVEDQVVAAKAFAEAQAERNAEAAAIEECRKAAQLSESATLQGKTLSTEAQASVIQLPRKPSNGRIIEAVMHRFNCSNGTACDWILACAESMKEAA